jgi:phospholipid/cholesterol/gamma-HCH transport system substrate-binding protein
MESQSHAFFAGLFVILVGLAVVAGAVWLAPKGAALAPIDLLTAHSIAGLKVDAPVRFRGVDVGRVESIAFDKQRVGQIRVRIGVNPTAPITRSTYAKLSYEGINGVALIQLDDDRQKSSERLQLSAATVPQMELQAGLLERAEDDVRDVLLKVGRVASRVEELLNDQNEKRLMALVDSVEQTSQRYGTLARDFEPSAKELPGLLREARRTAERAQGAVDGVAKLTADIDRKLVLDTLAAAAKQIQRVADDLHQDSLPRVNALIDEVAVDARELKRPLHEAGVQPQSFIFGLQRPQPGPGEPGFKATLGEAR